MWKFIKQSFWVNAVLAFVGAAALYGVGGAVIQAVEFRREARHTRAQILELTKKKEALERSLEEIQTSQVIEREAKERLNLKLPGEEVVVVPAEPVPDKMEEKQGVLERLKQFFQ